jgi:hypothetical protein
MLQVGTVLESYEDADIPFLWFPSIGRFWVRALPLQLFVTCMTQFQGDLTIL